MVITIPTPQRARRVGNSLVITIPADVVEQHHLEAGDLLRVMLEPMTVVPKLRPEIAAFAGEETTANIEALRYLRDN